MKLKRILLAALVATAVSSGTAQAALGPVFDLSAGPVVVGGSIPAGAFSFSNAFSLSAVSGVGAFVNSTQLTFNGAVGGGISGLLLTITSSGGAVGSAAGVVGPATPITGLPPGFTGSTRTTTASWAGLLGPGLYSANVSGNATAGAAYSLLLSAAPVPEASGWVMMLAGLGAIGLMIGRRRTPATLFGV